MHRDRNRFEPASFQGLIDAIFNSGNDAFSKPADRQKGASPRLLVWKLDPPIFYSRCGFKVQKGRTGRVNHDTNGRNSGLKSIDARSVVARHDAGFTQSNLVVDVEIGL